MASCFVEADEGFIEDYQETQVRTKTQKEVRTTGQIQEDKMCNLKATKYQSLTKHLPNFLVSSGRKVVKTTNSDSQKVTQEVSFKSPVKKQKLSQVYPERHSVPVVKKSPKRKGN